MGDSPMDPIKIFMLKIPHSCFELELSLLHCMFMYHIHLYSCQITRVLDTVLKLKEGIDYCIHVHMIMSCAVLCIFSGHQNVFDSWNTGLETSCEHQCARKQGQN